MFDESCGEIFGPTVISKEQPARVHRDFSAILEDILEYGMHCKRADSKFCNT